jgi:hypothetical protein
MNYDKRFLGMMNLKNYESKERKRGKNLGHMVPKIGVKMYRTPWQGNKLAAIPGG